MSESPEEVQRRQTFLRVMGLTLSRRGLLSGLWAEERSVLQATSRRARKRALPGLVEGRTMSDQRWQPCARCRRPTQYAVAGNRLLSRWDIQHLPAVGIPALSWRCEQHPRYKLRAPSIVWATADGDLCFMLACGHQTHQVCRDRWAYTSALVERRVDTFHINLERRQRCYACADVEREGERQP